VAGALGAVGLTLIAVLLAIALAVALALSPIWVPVLIIMGLVSLFRKNTPTMPSAPTPPPAAVAA
jgi:hypothetical protein